MKRRDLKPGDVFRYKWAPDMIFYVPPKTLPVDDEWVRSDSPHNDDEVELIGSEPQVVSEKVEDPSYYKNLNPEPVDVTEGWRLNPNLASVIWYIARSGKKTPDAKSDLLKARRFLSREIAALEGRRAWE
jgi:hypothetical protein